MSAPLIKQCLYTETFDSYQKCEEFLDRYISIYGETERIESFNITKVLDNDWRLIILYSKGETN